MMPAAVAGHEIVQTLHDGARTLVCRARRPGDDTPVVLKLLRPADATEQARADLTAEYEVTARADVPGTVKVRELREDSGWLALVLEDVGGESLDRRCERGPLPIALFLDLAVGLAGTVASLHQLRIVHKNINPANIVLDATGEHAVLVDFGMADDVPEHFVPVRPATALEGAPGYLSPEQSGRTNRPVDYRTDLYSLGATFYHLVTGRPPFTGEDALALIHQHLAQDPVPPRAIRPAVPAAVSRIILKLLAKTPDDRYQSARGLLADLTRCRDRLAATGEVGDLEPGLEDFSERLSAPQRLYGREEETRRLLDEFERAARGEQALVLVTGYAGVGKTALVHELNRPALGRRAHVVEGKFDQLQRNLPYSGWAQAFTGLVRYLLMGPPDELERWKKAIIAGVGHNGRVLTDLVPELELVIGPQPAVPELTGPQASNRLAYVFVEFVRAIATADHPLVIFLDDLQWIDAASLELLQTLVGGDAVSHLLVIGAYRDQEVDELHPLSVAVETMRKDSGAVDVLDVGDLSGPTTTQLVADTLRCTPSRAEPLARLVHAKTAGNPFFTLQTLRTLAADGALTFDVASRHWRWDLAAIEALNITNNVVTLMVAKIQQLPADPQHLLRLAACIGFEFEIGQLAAIAEQPEGLTRSQLRPAWQEGLLVPSGVHHRFVHDRVQQAAYSLIPDGDRQRVHLAIGRSLRARLDTDLPERDRERMVLTVADHLNVAAELLSTGPERRDLARLDLQAGVLARASAAFSAAAGYFVTGTGLLDDGSWTTDYDLALELHTLAADAAGLTGDFVATDQYFAVVARQARDAVDRVGVYRSRMNAFTARGMLQDTVDTALEILGLLGIHIPASPTAEDVDRARRGALSAAGPVAAEAIERLPRMTEPVPLAAMGIIDLAAGSAVGGRPQLNAVLAFESVRLTLEHGLAPESLLAFCNYAFVLCGLPDGDVEHGFGTALLARSLARREDPALAAKVNAIAVGMTWHHKRHLRDPVDVLQPLYPQLKEAGEFAAAGYVLVWTSCYGFLAGQELERLEHRMAGYDTDLRRIRAEQGRRRVATFRQTALNLLGRSSCPWVVDGEAYDRTAMVRALEETGNVSALSLLHVNTLLLCYLFGRYDDALTASEAARSCSDGLFGSPMEPLWHAYDSLTRLATARDAAPAQREAVLAQASDRLDYLRDRAHHAPMNYLHVHHLVQAERARVLGDADEAIRNYGRAAVLATEQGFVHEAALADELLARFWAERGNDDYARLHLERAHRGYRRWQAWAKVSALEAEHPYLVASAVDPSAGPDTLDLETVMKATGAISREIDLDLLLTAIVQIVVENAGAQSGWLLMPHENGDWKVAAYGRVGAARVEIPTGGRIPAEDEVPLSVVRYVSRTRDRVVLDDARQRGDFVTDPHVVSAGVRSLLCAPMLTSGRLVGVLCLENNLTTRAFTPQRVELLQTVLAPAATALENAASYQALRVSEDRYRRLVDTTTEGIWVCDRQGRTTFTNVRMTELLGRGETDLVDRPMSDFLVDVPAERTSGAQAGGAQSDRRPPAPFVPGTGPARNVELGFRRRDGSILWGLASTAVILDEQQEVEGWLTMVTDITDRKAAEEALHALNAQLERRVAERTVDLQAANADLEAFSYTVSHDLKAPLRRIRDFCALLLEEHRTQLDAQGRHRLDAISASAARMARMIDDTLGFSRISQRELTLVTVDLDALVADAFADVRITVPDQRIAFTAGPLPPARCDRAMLLLTFMNLFANAAKFSAQRPVSRIEVGGRVDGDRCTYWVTDNGVGFDPRFADRIFQPFERLHPRSQFEGNGIGLAIVKRVVARHGGQVWADSVVGEGTTISFTLPSADPGR